jgi:prepilin-type N-terminal cleavage/methylation domain-containing protein
MRSAHRLRRGFTMIELLLSMLIMLAVVAVATQTFRHTTDLLGAQTGRLEALQNARFGIASLDRELRVAGIGVVKAQPMVVQASNLAITFNVDLVSRTSGDPGSVYSDTTADTNAVAAMRSSSKITLPGSVVQYPNSTYYQAAGIISGAETISYYLSKDSTTSDSNVYILYRRVNATTPRVIARNILVNPTDTVFQFFKSDSVGRLVAVTNAELPLVHTAAVHGSLADTGKFAIIDSVRTVRVKLAAMYHDPIKGKIFRTSQTTIRLMNAGLANTVTCGNPPIAVVLTGVASSGPTKVTLTWPASIDDGNGEKDVDIYALYRRPDTVATWDQPFTSVPAGLASYTYVDNNVKSGQHWIYGVTAIDCTPSSSTMGGTGTIIVP